MKKWYLFQNHKRKSQRGQGLIEYVLIISLVGVAVIVAVNLFEDALRNTFDSFIGRGEFAPPSLGPIGGNFTPRPATPTPVPVPPEINAFGVTDPNPYQIGDPTEQHEFTFTMSASDSDGIITQYKFEIDLNNDGTLDDEIVWFPSDPVPTYTLGRGSHVVKLIVSDSTSLTTSRRLPIQVYVDSSELQDLPPTVDITVSPTNGNSPLTVNLSGVATPDHDSTIVSYTWVLGNGATRSGSSITYVYEEGGTYEVYLQVTDNEGMIGDSERVTINVVASTPTPSLTPSNTPTPAHKKYRYILLFAESEVNGGPWTSVAELYAIDGAGSEVSRATWSTNYVDSQESDGIAEYIWDGNTGTIWHTEWRNTTPTHPHQVQINMGAEHSLSGFRYIPRQSGQNGRVRGYRLCASTDGVNYELLKAGVFPNTSAEQIVSFSPPLPSTTLPQCIPAATFTPTYTPTPSNTPTNTPVPTGTPVNSCVDVAIEAELAALSGSFVIGNDNNASGGQYVHAPNGSGGQSSANNNSATFQFNLGVSGTYRLRGYVYGSNGSDDSFFVDVNGSPNGGYLWDINRNTNYNPDFVNDRNGADPVEFDLSAGLNTVRVSLREDGARLDKLELVCVSTAPVATPTVPAITLFSDDFNRSNNNSLNNGWTEEETGNAKMAIENGEMCVTESSDTSRRPMASHTFTYMDKGKIIWSYDFDWTRSGNEGTYYLYMQLGDSNNMSKNSTSNGVAVNAVWSRISGTHERLGYSDNNNLTGVATVSGSHNIVITADLDAKTYSIAVDGTTYQTGIPFDNNVSQIDTVRIFTDSMSTGNFSGRCFDNINIVTQQ